MSNGLNFAFPEVYWLNIKLPLLDLLPLAENLYLEMTSSDELKKKCGEQLHFEPFQTLMRLAKSAELDITDARFARLLDERDELKNLREEFHYPKMKDLPSGKLELINFETS